MKTRVRAGVFVSNTKRSVVLTAGASFSTNFGLGDIAGQIEAIEEVGWHLDQFSTALSPGVAKHLVATCVFRRG
jgi:hypothetical protein